MSAAEPLPRLPQQSRQRVWHLVAAYTVLLVLNLAHQTLGIV